MREVPEWIADHDDQAIPARVKLRVFERFGGKCAITGRKFMPGDRIEFDHIIPLALGGAHAESNLQIVTPEAHKAKTRADVQVKAKVQRLREKFMGMRPKKRGLSHPTLRKKMDGSVVRKDQ